MNGNSKSALDKLREGQDALSSASNNPNQLGSALLMLHGALEDRLRELLAARLPARRVEIFDKGNFQWKDILEASQQYLGLSSADSDFITQANRYRNKFAHGNGFSWNRAGVSQYEQLILQVWATGSWARSAYRPQASAPAPAPRTRPAYQPPPRPAATTAPPVYPPPVYSPQEKPWYRSTGFLVFVFIFLTPVWAILILTDKSQGGCAKALAVFVFLSFLIAGFVMCVTLAGSVFFNGTSAVVQTPAAGIKPVLDGTSAQGASQPRQEILPTDPAAGCRIAWVKYPGSDLARKNRSMVWNEIVSAQVTGSGMTPEQFYQQVAEQNPFLAADGYEFKEGKTYWLPRCE